MSRRLALALAVAAAIVLSSPWLGELREWLRAIASGRFVILFNLSLAILAVLILVAAIGRIRRGRADRAASASGRSWTLRAAAAAGALAIAATWAVLNQQMSAETNAVERFHFLEYGFMTWLFYRAAQGRAGTDGSGRMADLSWVALPIIAGVIVGIADEALQWYVPLRVGEIRDVFLNLAAVGAGLLMSLAVDPPSAFRMRLAAPSRRRLALAAAAVILALAGFLHAVHVGHRIADPEIGVFLSRYTAGELRALAADRSERWRLIPPPLEPTRLSREDQYLFEANRHVQQRNNAWADDARRAWFENRVLEAYFGPALDFPSYAVPAGSKWPAAQRADAEARMKAAEPEPFVSYALAGYILEWPKTLLWIVAAALALAILLAGFL